MLILTRRAGEAILIDGGIRIVVLGSDAGGVRLGIEAPSSVGILREEVVERIAEENVRAGTTEDAGSLLRDLTEGREAPPPDPDSGRASSEEDPGPRE